MKNMMASIIIACSVLFAVAVASKHHEYNPYKEGGYYHFDHRGIPHWHPGRYHYHDYEEYIHRSPKYLRYISEPESRVSHVERVPTYTRTYEVPTTYRQVETQYHRPDDKTIIEKKIYKQDVPAHYRVKTTTIDGTHVHYEKA